MRRGLATLRGDFTSLPPTMLSDRAGVFGYELRTAVDALKTHVARQLSIVSACSHLCAQMIRIVKPQVTLELEANSGAQQHNNATNRYVMLWTTDG